MSMYNMMHGVGDTASVVFAVLGLVPEDFGRFRDAWVNPGGDTVSVFTRCGGGNREGYQDVFAKMAKHPMFLTEEDDDYDPTYATFVFRVPEEHLAVTRAVAPAAPEPSLREKTESVLSALKKK